MPGADEDDDATESEGELLGLKLTELTDEGRETYSLSEEAKGALVTDVDPESTAWQKGVRPGNVIVEVAQEVVSTPDEVIARVKKLREDGRKNALLLVANAEGDLQFVVLRIE